MFKHVLGRTAAVLATAAAATVLSPATAAHAGASCSLAGCSETVNQSDLSVYAARNWCIAGSDTGATTTTTPTCSSDGVAQATRWVTAGTQTPSGQDWDTFRVDAGFCYKVSFKSPIDTDFTKTYDRRGTSAVWVKVEDDYTAYVTSQKTATC
ncbi:hypothetical protein [Streptomyces fructofermentans]|uniref:Secreted protein n=1 Tax=Streptomyces fructofermentans TaxID=152141 RepID=A0A918NJW4_9ACTN|nr:hypothetical protein [Streptomyces fructofermentans]GGX76365.1 hypothetical protein GCM10010515_50140 [Streptomyces fructofermentans]